MSVAAIILCGGQSRRMGQPKAWLPFGPERMLQRVVRLVASVANPIVVVTAPDQAIPPLPDDVLIVRDPLEGRGPLQGLASGLAGLPDSVDLVFATATDVPFLNPTWVRILIDRIGENDLVIPFVDGYYHPLAALYRRTVVLPEVLRLLDGGTFRPVALTDRVRTVVLDADVFRAADPNFETLRNLNHPEDYDRALREAGFPDDGSIED